MTLKKDFFGNVAFAARSRCGVYPRIYAFETSLLGRVENGVREV